MSGSHTQPTVFVIGNKDDRLVYLLKRYAEQGGCRMIFYESAPEAGEIGRLRPAAIIFSSIEQLQVAQPLVETLSAYEIPVLVCAALADEVQARELGADACLMHPLTYDDFRTTLSNACQAGKN